MNHNKNDVDQNRVYNVTIYYETNRLVNFVENGFDCKSMANIDKLWLQHKF